MQRIAHSISHQHPPERPGKQSSGIGSRDYRVDGFKLNMYAVEGPKMGDLGLVAIIAISEVDHFILAVVRGASLATMGLE